ncbi:O-antigen ligase family protein [Micavibrio aeruginosavorus]|uniref:Putative bicarbonate transporter, ICT family protein n=1 Tax=Micavibrio aeruginosavorus EPB TaxID=349215 RepID=M4VHH5_9BACT|nr:O-antigen ligase family protein [Micavibrio aeruginosavorus]AGH97476.1 putative bicarbonate transporter, ICT family protein [Micavibrio aeruginosavorus EPB]
MIHPAAILPVICLLAASAIALPLSALQDPGLAVVTGLILLAGACTAFPALRAGRMAIPATATALSLLGLWGWMGVSMALSPVPFHSLIAFCTFSALPLTFFIIGTHPQRDVMVRWLMVGLLGLFCLLALPALWQFITGVTTRAHWPMLDPNILCTLFALALPLALAHTLTAMNRAQTIVGMIACALLCAAIIATGSRGGLVAALVALVTLIAFMDRTLIKRAIAPVSVMVLSMALMVFVLGPQTTTIDRLATLTQNGAHENGLLPRLIMHDGSIRMMMDNPIVGTGPGTFFLVYPGYRGSISDTSLGAWAHCDPLQWGAEAGIPALILFYIILCTVLVRTIRAMRMATPDRRMDILVPFTALLAVAIQSHVQFPLQTLAALIPCGILLTAWHQATAQALQNGDATIAHTPGPKRTGFMVATLAVLVLFIAITVPIGGALFEMRAASRAWASDDPADARNVLIHLARADRWGPDSFIDPEVTLARINISMINANDAPTSRTQLINETTDLLDAATHWNPYWADIDALRGDLALAIGLRDAARGHYMRALQKNPLHFNARIALAHTMLDDKKMTDAVQLLDMGLRMPHPGWYRTQSVALLKSYGLAQ